MCGMFGIKGEKWEAKMLSFDVVFMGAESMKVIVHVPEGKAMDIKKISTGNARSSYSIDGNFLKVSVRNEKMNKECRVSVKF